MFLGITAVLLSTQARVFAAEATTSTPSPPAQAGPATLIQIRRYPEVRVGDIAPTLLGTDAAGKEWKTQDNYGQRATALLFDGGYPVFAPWLAQDKVARETSQSYKSGVAVVIASSHMSATNRFDEKSQVAVFRTPNEDLQKMFGLMTRVVIDRAGFVRRIEELPHEVGMQGALAHGLSDPTPKLQVGSVAPDFSIPDMNGTVRRVSDLRGKKNLLLTFFPKCFTGGCTNHLSGIQKEYLSYIASDTEVWAVSVDPAEGEKGQKAFAERWNLRFPLIPDVGRNLSILYGAAENPVQLSSRMSVLIDKDGIVRLIDKKVDVYTHGSDMILEMRRNGMIAPPLAASTTEK